MDNLVGLRTKKMVMMALHEKTRDGFENPSDFKTFDHSDSARDVNSRATCSLLNTPTTNYNGFNQDGNALLDISTSYVPLPNNEFSIFQNGHTSYYDRGNKQEVMGAGSTNSFNSNDNDIVTDRGLDNNDGIAISVMSEDHEVTNIENVQPVNNNDEIPVSMYNFVVENAEVTDNRQVEPATRDDGFPVFVENMNADAAAADHAITEYTKKGTIRKRKKYETSVEQRKKAKGEVLAEKHKVRNGCGENCLKQCIKKIPHERRVFLNNEFWKLANEKERKSFLLHHVSSGPVKQRTTTPDADGRGYKRNHSLTYMLKNEIGTSQSVCKIFFLTTFGFDKNNDKVLRTTLLNAKNSVQSPADMRCKKLPHNKIDDEVIQNHISSFNPTISHYRREHAPHRLYLPSDLTFNAMYQHFLRNNPNFKISYEKYRVVAKKMHVSLANLGHEECEHCEMFKLHEHSKENLDENCEICKVWQKHIERAEKSRARYREDSNKSEENDEIVYCADLEKVIMLPRLDMFKTVIFTNRLTAYNESFVPVGKKRTWKPFAAVWHEALFKRNKEDIISTFYQFFLSKRDVLRVILWLDNCTAQNKNWAFFSFLIYIINSDIISANEITIKYFEPGHTFMAADSFHHKVELSMKKMGNKLYDFGDFVKAVKSASSQTEVLPMELEHFYIWEDYSSQYKLSRITPRPYINEMVQVVVRRGSFNINYKNDFEGPSFDLNFLTAKTLKYQELPPPKKQQKFLGISRQKRENILKNLGGVMRNRLQFWENLPVSD